MIAQYVGIVSIFIIFCLKFYIAVYTPAFIRAGRAALFWFSIYALFLFLLRFLQLLGVTDADTLRIISGFTTLIPLTAIIIHLLLSKRIEVGTEKIREIDKQL